MHYIQTHILDKLTFAEALRNTDMRPKGVESNLYQYHLLRLQKEGYVRKDGRLYTLSKRGLAYSADRHSCYLKKERPQPKILTILFVTNENGEILIRTKQRQPFIGQLGLITGKLHRDESVYDGANREFSEKVGPLPDSDVGFDEFGTAHVVVKQEGCVITDYVGVLFCVLVKNGIHTKPNVSFYDIDSLDHNLCSPGTIELLDAFKSRSQFYETFIEIG